MILAIQQNLERGINLLQNISDENYVDTSVAPYYSSIGIHIRHVLDVFDCIFEGLSNGKVNLIDRKRNELVEKHRDKGLAYFEGTISKLQEIPVENFDKNIRVTDDLGCGSVTVTYTVGAILAQAHSHAIHHFASIGYVISQLDIDLPDDMFGFNPTTPKPICSK